MILNKIIEADVINQLEKLSLLGHVIISDEIISAFNGGIYYNNNFIGDFSYIEDHWGDSAFSFEGIPDELCKNVLEFLDISILDLRDLLLIDY